MALAVGESADQTAEQSAVDAMLRELAPAKPIPSRKLREIVRLFRTKELIEAREERFVLTETGVRAAAKCLETSRLQYPQVEQFFESGGFRRCFSPVGSAETVERGVSSASTPRRPDGAAASSPLVLPSLRWPLAPPEQDVVMGERVSPAEDITQELPDVAPVVVTGREEDWEVVLILDSREVRSLQDRSYLENHLRRTAHGLREINVVARVRQNRQAQLRRPVQNPKIPKIIQVYALKDRMNLNSPDPGPFQPCKLLLPV